MVWALLLLLTPLPTALGECDANALIVVLFHTTNCVRYQIVSLMW